MEAAAALDEVPDTLNVSRQGKWLVAESYLFNLEGKFVTTKPADKCGWTQRFALFSVLRWQCECEAQLLFLVVLLRCQMAFGNWWTCDHCGAPFFYAWDRMGNELGRKGQEIGRQWRRCCLIAGPASLLGCSVVLNLHQQLCSEHLMASGVVLSKLKQLNLWKKSFSDRRFVVWSFCGNKGQKPRRRKTLQSLEVVFCLPDILGAAKSRIRTKSPDSWLQRPHTDQSRVPEPEFYRINLYWNVDVKLSKPLCCVVKKFVRIATLMCFAQRSWIIGPLQEVAAVCPWKASSNLDNGRTWFSSLESGSFHAKRHCRVLRS